MLKRFSLAVIFASIVFAGFAAQLTATLQSGDKMTPFYGSNAFVDALKAAVDGDVITLSPGEFAVTEVTKGVTVIGANAFVDSPAESTILGTITVSADNVTFEAIRLNNLAIKGTDGFNIKRCHMGNLLDTEKESHKYHDNTIITDCIILCHNAMQLSKNMVIRNSCVNYFEDCNEISNPALMENCNIALFSRYYYNPATYCNTQPYAIYRNCLLGLYANTVSSSTPTITFSAPSEFHNCMLYHTYFDSFSSGNLKRWTINYGSAVNDNNKTTSGYGVTSYNNTVGSSSLSPYTYNDISYGPSNPKTAPAIPEITSSEIDNETDADGNLHVKIIATARD